LDDIIQKFINEYVQKLSQQQQNGFSEDDDDGNDMINEDFVDD
jgi:succinate dehydrogenase flavin-adding protein (antitoxin of CptAB toxin-antitoxin module)